MASITIYIPKDKEKLLRKAIRNGIKPSELFCDALECLEAAKRDDHIIKEKDSKEAHRYGFFRGSDEGRRKLLNKIDRLADTIDRALKTAKNH